MEARRNGPDVGAVAGASARIALGEGWGAEARKRLGRFLTDSFFNTAARAGRLHPRARPESHGVSVVRDVPYMDTGRAEHLLDIYLPPAGHPAPRPVVLYLHGGGFRILSKDTHWIMGIAYARRGYTVFNANYRLAPDHPFPAAVEDGCAALGWVARNARRFGGDPSRLVFAGESAGANLSVSLALAACYRREEAYARAVWAAGVRPRAVVAACGLFQVSDAARFGRRRRLPAWILDRLTEVEEAYLPAGRRGCRRETDGRDGEMDLADPLLALERGRRPRRKLPAFFLPVGTKDPILDDTRRLKQALDGLGADCEARYYVGEPHAFHGFVFTRNARRCWRDTFAFLDRHVAT